MLLFLIGSSFAGGYYFAKKTFKGTIPPFKGKPVSLDLVQEVIATIRHSYVEKVPEEKLILGAAKGVVEALNDPYSHYLSKTHYKYFQEETTGYFFGIGIQIGIKDHHVTVISPIEGTPADRAGIKAGDIILKVDGKSVAKLPLDSVVSMIRGEEGTFVTLDISRVGRKEPLTFKVKRAKIELPNVSSKMLDKDLGYVRIHTFSQETGQRLRDGVAKLIGEGAKGIILDLRNNPGGLLEEAVEVASVFIDKGVIVRVKSRSGKEEIYEAVSGIHGMEKPFDVPLVILINKGSASASEIVAGAVQDLKRGILVGEKTFGKGSVQNMVPLTNGAGLVLTTARYYTPNGKQIHGKGLKPDYLVKGGEELMGKKDKQLEKAKEVIKSLIRTSKKKG